MALTDQDIRDVLNSMPDEKSAKNNNLSENDIKEGLKKVTLPPSGMGNFARGFVNPLVQLLNVTPDSINSLLAAAGSNKKLPDIPQIPGGDSQSGAYTLGNIASYIVPGIGTDRLLARSAMNAPKLIAPFLQKALPRTMIGGATTGAAMAPTNQRTEGALWGLAGGPAGLAVGKAIHLPKFLLGTPAFQKLSDIISPSLGETDSPLMKTATAIANNYNKLKDMSNNLYNKFGDLLKGHKIDVGDLPAYQNAYKSILDKSGIDKEFSPENLTNSMGGQSYWNVTGKIKKGVSMDEINKIRSGLLTAKRDAFNSDNSTLGKKYGALADALHDDMQNYMQKNAPEAFPAYRQAQDFYREKIVPFDEHQGASQIASLMDKNKGDINALYTQGDKLNINDFRPSGNSSEDMTRLNKLAKVLQSPQGQPDYKQAADLSKGLIFKEAAPDKAENFDISKYIKKYNSLTEDQKNFIFSSDENEILKNMKEFQKRKGSSSEKFINSLGKLIGSVAAGGAAADVIGGHAGISPLTSALIGMAGGAAAHQPISQGATSLAADLLPSSKKLLLHLLSPYKENVITKQVMPALGTGIGGAITRGGNQ